MYFCSLHAEFGECLHLVEESFRIFAETTESVLICGVYFHDVAIA
jgi:hypothetical protein